MSAPRGLSEDEAAAWEKLAATVSPFEGRVKPAATVNSAPPAPPAKQPLRRVVKSPAPRAAPIPAPKPPPRRVVGDSRLDSHWDRKLKSGAIAPDFTLDLHGHGLDAAHGRLEDGVAQARAMGARLVLVVTGKPRPVEAADRGSRRGAIRAKLLDWLAAGPHADAIAAIRKAHRRHGGEGALYLVLRRGI